MSAGPHPSRNYLELPLGQRPDADELRRAWNERRPHERASVGRRLSWWLSGEYRLTPPSADKKLSEIAAAADSYELLAVLKGADRPRAIWAYEVLRKLPDEELERLTEELSDSTITRVTTVAYPGGLSNRDEGFPVGELIRFQLEERAARQGGRR